MTQPLTYQIDRRLPIAVVRLTGELTSLSTPVARVGLFESLAAEPSSLIVDLSALTVTDDVALTLFVAVAEQAAQWPGAPLLLCAPDPAVAAALHRTAVDRRLPVFPHTAAALEVAAKTPVPLRLHRQLSPTVQAPRIARSLVSHACWDWDLPRAATPAQIISSELVTNAVRHAGTSIDLTITLRDDHLRVSVRDRVRQQARLQTPAESDDHGRGLLIVDTVATAWGNVSIADGKAVWAALRVAPGPTREGAVGRTGSDGHRPV